MEYMSHWIFLLYYFGLVPFFIWALIQGTRKQADITVGLILLIFVTALTPLLREFLVISMHSDFFDRILIQRKW